MITYLHQAHFDSAEHLTRRPRPGDWRAHGLVRGRDNPSGVTLFTISMDDPQFDRSRDSYFRFSGQPSKYKLRAMKISMAGSRGYGIMALLWSCGVTGAWAGERTDVELTEKRVVLTLEQRHDLGFIFGPSDGSIGAIPKDRGYFFFVSAMNRRKEGGIFRLMGTLSRFESRTSPGPALRAGTAPDGFSFDRDYAGGGAVTPIEDDRGRHGVLLIYHAEFQPGSKCQKVPWYYSDLGAAVSTDGGQTFRSLGEIVQPSLSRPQWQAMAPCQNAGVGYGTLVLGDDKGDPLDPSRARWDEGYYYVFYTDHGPKGGFHTAVARAKRAEVIKAAFDGNTHAFPKLFQKFNNGQWTPATGGNKNDSVPSGLSSPLDPEHAFGLSVLYDREIRGFLMSYVAVQGGKSRLEIQTSSNLLKWPGKPVATVPIESSQSQLGYATLVGETGDPRVGGRAPVLYYLNSWQWFPNWSSPQTLFESRELRLDGHLEAPPHKNESIRLPGGSP